MVKNKTIETRESVAGFLKTITDAKKRADVLVIIELVTKHTGLEPKMWGTSIVGFGSYHYKYENDELTICYNLLGNSYPETFETSGKPMYFLSVFKKEIK